MEGGVIRLGGVVSESGKSLNLYVSVPRLRCGECLGERGGSSGRVRPSRHQETRPLDRPGRNLPLSSSSRGQFANDINPLASAGSKDLHTKSWSEPVWPPLSPLKASLTA